MLLSDRIKNVPDSITLKLNEKAQKLAEEGNQVYNLTAGQLPSRPIGQFIERLHNELNFLKSYQYSPVAGFPALRKKVIEYFENSRGVSLSTNLQEEFDCVISNGGKHAIYNAMGTVLNPEDEVILLAPYWVSYPEMIKFWGARPVVVKSEAFDGFTPKIEDIEKAISSKTKMIVLNSPNNPSGIHYSDEWMGEFAKLLKNYPDTIVLSDEIYYELYYYDPAPTYFYQKDPSLLNQTIIIDGISKTFACTGLRIGYTLAPKSITQAMSKLQAQTSSGANSLVQRALIDFDFSLIGESLKNIRQHLRMNAGIIREKFREADLGKSWYQSLSAFYFMVNFKSTPVFETFQSKDPSKTDFAAEICDALLSTTGVALVPGSDFGAPNCARMSLVTEQAPFEEALTRLTKFLNKM